MTEKDYKHDLYYSKQEGIEKEKLETAKRMKSLELPVDVISKSTELSEEVILAL